MGELKTGYWNTITWTPEMIERLVEGRRQRVSFEKLGKEFGISDRACKNQMCRMGLPTSVPQPDAATLPQIHEPLQRTDELALLMRQATLPLPMPAPSAAPSQCQWALNDSRPWQFCYLPTIRRRRADGTEERTAWCSEHYKRVYQPRFPVAA